MTCREFGPTLDKFCSDAKDFVDPKQLVQMATYFGIKGPELKKVKLMAAREQTSRSVMSGDSQSFPPKPHHEIPGS